MRSCFTSLLFVAILAACRQPGSTALNNGKVPFAVTGAGNTDTAHLTSIEWKEKSVDYGRIEEGEKLDIEFHFTNTGSFPLTISRVEPSCGCTIAEILKEPIAPGKEGVIKGSFNSNGKAHANHKTLLVYANAKGVQPSELSFDVEVEPKK